MSSSGKLKGVIVLLDFPASNLPTFGGLPNVSFLVLQQIQNSDNMAKFEIICFAELGHSLCH